MHRLFYVISILNFGVLAKKNHFIMDLNGGSSWTRQGTDLEFKANYYILPIDQMLFLGLGSGYRQFSNHVQVPINTTLYLRLPMGQILMPVFRLSTGYLLGYDHRYYWASELVGDLKLGNSSSLLFGVGVEAYSLRKITYRPNLSIGLLIEK